MPRHVVASVESSDELLRFLFGDGLEVSEGEEVDSGFVATYLDDNEQLAAICIADLEFSIFSGAAMSLIPKAGADDAIRANELTDVLRDNLGEVMNILSRLLMNDSSPHIRFAELLDVRELPSLVEALGEVVSVSLRVSIPSYGDGNITFRVS